MEYGLERPLVEIPAEDPQIVELSQSTLSYFRSVLEGKESLVDWFDWWSTHDSALRSKMQRRWHHAIFMDPLEGLRGLLNDRGVECRPYSNKDAGPSDLEYEVYRAVLATDLDFYRACGVDHSTTGLCRTHGHCPFDGESLRKLDPSGIVDRQLLGDYLEKNRFVYTIDEKRLRPDLNATSEGELFEKSQGHVAFSRVGFDAAEQRAAVFPGWRDTLGGRSEDKVFFLVSEAGQWVVVRKNLELTDDELAIAVAALQAMVGSYGSAIETRHSQYFVSVYGEDPPDKCLEMLSETSGIFLEVRSSRTIRVFI